MNKSILLLDSTDKILDKFTKQGFDIQAGSVGFCSTKRSFPTQLYEKDIFIYDPVLKPEIVGFTPSIENLTPQFGISEMFTAIKNGGVLLALVKELTEVPNLMNMAYGWIPLMPQLNPTMDNIVTINKSGSSEFKLFSPLLGSPIVKPVKVTLDFQNNPLPREDFFYNLKEDVLGAYYEYGSGTIIVLPEYSSSEELIDVFLHRVVSKLVGAESGNSVVDNFISSDESKIKKKIEDKEKEIQENESDLQQLIQDLATSSREKDIKIKEDETAVLILNYYDLALRQEDVALFYIAKITEALENKYGGEGKAKGIFKGLNAEWNKIGKLANASYADIRHAPKPGEKIKEWSQTEIEECFDAAKKIIQSYIEKLF